MGKAGKPATGKRKRVGGAEEDAFTQYYRHWTKWRPRSRHWIKKKASRRERHEAKRNHEDLE